MFPPAVERWRAVAIRAAPDIPSGLVLAFIDRESGGVPGRVAYADVKIGYTDAERACGLPAAIRRRCLGLMQVAPVTWRDYVARTGEAITPCDLASKTTEGAERQIRIGAAALRSCLAFAGWRGEPNPSDQIVLMGRLAYARGIRAVSDKLAAAKAAGYPATFAGLEAFDPTWGRPDHPFDGARGVLAKYRADRGDTSPPFLVSPREPETPSAAIAIPAIVILGLLFWFSLRK